MPEPIPRLLGRVRPAEGEPPSDRALLTRFADAGDEAAFRELLRRHGPLVRGVCRRVLGDADLADDAFQATFLVLAKKAAAVRNRDAVAAWLYGVAHRLAVRLRSRRDAERRRE